MARPTMEQISIIDPDWYVKLNNNFEKLLEEPFPIPLVSPSLEPVNARAYFVGSSYIDFGNPTELQITDNLTIQVKLREINPLVTSRLVSKYGTGATERAYRMSSSGVMSVLLSSTGSNTTVKYDSVESIENGDLLKATYIFNDSGDDLKLYIDDVLLSPFKDADNAMSAIYNSTASLVLGDNVSGTPASEFMVEIYHVKMWDGTDLVLDFDPEQYGDLLDHSAYEHPSTNSNVVLVSDPSLDRDARLFKECLGVYLQALYTSDGSTWDELNHKTLDFVEALDTGTATLDDIKTAFNNLLADMRSKDWIR